MRAASKETSPISISSDAPIFTVGLDVHKDSVTAAVFRDRDPEPLRVNLLSYDLEKIRCYFQRLQADGSVRACQGASGAGYVLQRTLTEWGVVCDLAAPSLISRRAGDHRKTDHRDTVKLALTPRDKPVVDRLGCFRGFKTHAAMVLATELGDVRRFESPRQLMAYVGLVPREHSSGDRQRLGGITKAGNSRVRHTLIQAAWHDRNQPRVGTARRRRQQDRDPGVIAHAWKCQHRLYRRFHRLAARKPNPVAATTVAREMVGFLWAVLKDIDVTQLQREQEAANAA